MIMSDVLTCNVVLPWARVSISSVHFLVPSASSVYMRSSGAVPVSVSCTRLRFLSDFCHFCFLVIFR